MAEDESDDEIELIAAHDNRGQKVELVNLKKSFGHGGASKPTITTGEGGAWGRGAAAKEAPKQKVVTGGGGRGSGKKVVSRGWLGARSAEKAGLARPLKAMNMTPSVQKLGQGGLGGSPQEKKSLPKATGAKADGSRGGPVVGPSASVPEAEETVQERPAAPGGKKKVGRPKKKALVGSSLPTGSVGKKADPLNGVAGASQSVKTAKKAGMPEGVSGMGGTEREPSPKKRKRGRPPKSAAAKRNAAPLEAPPKWVTAGENEDGDTIWKIASPEKNEVTTRLLDSERVEKAATAAASLGRPIGHDGATAGRGAATAGKVEATAGVGAGTAGAGVGTGGLHAGEASGVKLGGKGHAGQAGKRKLDRTTSGESIEDVPLAKIGKMGKGGAKVPQKVLRLEEKILFDRATEKAGPSELSGKEGTDDKGGEIVHEKVAVGAVDKGGVSASAHVPLGQVLAQLTQGRTENGKGGGASLSGGEPLPAQQDPQLFTAPMGFKTLPAKRTFPGGPSQVSVAKKPKLAGGRRARALRANLEAGSGAAGVSGTTKGAPSEGLPRGSQQTEGAGMAARLGGEANVVERKAGLAANKSGSGGQAVKAEERAVTGGERRPGQKVKSASPLKNVAASNRNPPSARDPERMANQAGQSAGAPANGKEERRAKGGGSASTAAREGGRRVEGVQRLGPISTTGELLKTLSASLKVPLTAPVTESQNNPNAPLPERPAQTPSAVPKQPARLKVPKAEAEDLSEIVDVKPIIKGTAARASPDLPASPTGSVSTKPLQGGNSQAKGAPPVLFPAAPQKAPGTSPGGKGNSFTERPASVPHNLTPPPVAPRPPSYNPPRAYPSVPPLPDGPPPAASRAEAHWSGRQVDTSDLPAHNWQGQWRERDPRLADHRQPPMMSAREVEPPFVPPWPQYPPPLERSASHPERLPPHPLPQHGPPASIPHQERLPPQNPGAASKTPFQGSPPSWPHPLHPGGNRPRPAKDPVPGGEKAHIGRGGASDPRGRLPEQGRRADLSAPTPPGAARSADVGRQRRADVGAPIPLGRRHAQAPAAARVADVSRDGRAPNPGGMERKQMGGAQKNPPVPSSSSAAGGSAKRDKKLVWGGGIWSGGELKAKVDARALGNGGERIWKLPAERIDLTGTVPVDSDLKIKAVNDIEDPILLLTSAKQSPATDGSERPPFAGLGNTLAPGTASIADIPACTDEEEQLRSASLYIMSYTMLKLLLGKGLKARSIDFDETLAESALFGVVMLGDVIHAEGEPEAGDSLSAPKAEVGEGAEVKHAAGDSLSVPKAATGDWVGQKRAVGASLSEPKAEIGEGAGVAGTGSDRLSPATEMEATGDGKKAEVPPEGQLDRPESAGGELAKPQNEADNPKPGGTARGAPGLVDDSPQPAAGRKPSVAELKEAPRLSVTDALPDTSDMKPRSNANGLAGPRTDELTSLVSLRPDGPGGPTWQPKKAPNGGESAEPRTKTNLPPGFHDCVGVSPGVSRIASGGPKSRQSGGGDPPNQVSGPMSLETVAGNAEVMSGMSDVSKEKVCGEPGRAVPEVAEERSAPTERSESEERAVEKREKQEEQGKVEIEEPREEKGGPVRREADGPGEPTDGNAEENEARIRELQVRQQERERQDRRDRNRAQQAEREKAAAEARRDSARARHGELERGRERRNRSPELEGGREKGDRSRELERGRETRNGSPKRGAAREERGAERGDRSRERGAAGHSERKEGRGFERGAERERERRTERSPPPRRALEGGSAEKRAERAERADRAQRTERADRAERAPGNRTERLSELNERGRSPARGLSREEERAKAHFDADWAAHKRTSDPRLLNLWVTSANPDAFDDPRFRDAWVRELVEVMSGPHARKLGFRGGLRVADDPKKAGRSLLLRLKSMDDVARVLYLADEDWSLVPDRCRLGCDKRYRVLYNAKLKWMRKDRENGARHRSSSESRERPRANTRERSLSRRETSMEQKGGKVDTPRGRDGSGRSFSGVGDRGKAPREQTPRADTGVGDREKAPGQETPRAQSKGRDGDSERALKDCDTAAKGEGKVQKMVAEGGKRPPEEGGSVEPGCLSLSPDSTTPADVQKESDVQLADGVNLEKAELADERKLGKVELGEGVVEADGSGEGVVKGGAGSGGTEVGKIDRDMDGSVNEGARSEAGGVNTVSNPGREEVAAPTEERLVKEDSSGEEADPTQKELNLVEPEPGAVKEERASERFILKDPPEPKKRPFLFDLNEPPPVEIEDEDEPLDGSENGLAGRLSVIPPGEETPSNAGEAMEGPTQQMESAPEERSQDWDEDEGPELPPGFEGFYLEQSVRSMGPIGDGRGELGSVDQDCAAVLEELQGLPRGEADVSKDGDVSEHASREEVSRARRARWEAIRRRVDAEGAGEKTEPEATRGGGPEETGAGGTEETMGGGTEGTRGGGTEGTRGGGTEEDADAAPLEWLLREAKELAQRIKSKEQRGQKAGSTGAESRALPAQGGGSLSGARGVGGTPGADGDGESVPGGGRNVPPDPEPEATAARLRTEVGDAKAALGKIQEQLNKQFGIRLGPERSKTGNAGAGKTQDGGEVETGLRVEREDTGLLGEGKGGGAGWVLSAVRTSETKRKDASEMSKAGAQASGKEPEKVRGFWEDGEEGGLLPAKARLLGRKTKIQFGALEGLLEKGRAVGAPKQGPGVSRHQNGEGNQRGLNLLKQPKVSVNGAIAKSGARVKATGLGGGNWAPQSVAVAVPPVVGRAFMKVKEGTRQIAMWELDTALQERFYGRVRAIEASAHVTLTSAEAKDGRKGFLYEASSAAERDNARPLVHALLVDVSADIMKRREEVEAAASQPPPATCPQQTAPETDPVQVRPPLLWDGERWVVHFGEEPVAYATVPGAYEAALGQLPGQDALQVLAAYGQDAVEPGRGLGPYEWGPAPYELNSAASDGATLERWVSIGGLEGYVTQEVKAAGQANQAVSTGLPAASTDRKPAVQTVPKEPDEHLWRAPGVFATRLYRAGAHFERISEEVRELNLLEPLPPGVFAVPEQPPRGDKSPLPSKPVALGTASTKSPQRASDRSAPVLEPQPSMAVHTGGEGAETSEGELAPPGSDAERAALCAMTEWLRVDAEAPVPVSGGASHDVRREGGSGFGLRSGARSGSGVAISSLHPGATLPASASLQNGEPAKAQSLLQGAATVPSSGTEDASQTRQSGTGEQCQSLAAMDDGFEMIPRNGTAAPLSASGAGGAVVWNFPGGGESTGKGLTGCSTGPGLVKKALGESPWAVPGGVFGAACSAPSDDVWGSPTARSDSRERATREEEGANGGDVSTDGATTAPECFSEATSRPTSLVASGSTEILDPGEGAQDEVTSKVRGPGE